MCYLAASDKAAKLRDRISRVNLVVDNNTHIVSGLCSLFCELNGDNAEECECRMHVLVRKLLHKVNTQLEMESHHSVGCLSMADEGYFKHHFLFKEIESIKADLCVKPAK